MPRTKNAARSAPKGWKTVEIEWTGGPLRVPVPPGCVELTMGRAVPLADPPRAIREAMERPCAGPSLAEIIRRKGIPPARLRAALVVSDITRPVPYKGRNGILPPLLDILGRAGLRRENIRIVVGTGTHRASTAAEKRAMFGAGIAAGFTILDHDCRVPGGLVAAGRTPSGTDVRLNRVFFESDLKIITGLTESHFMAGASGGRKAVCPGLTDLATIQKFHSPGFLESPRADNLILDGNPCHEEASAVARAAGIDFAVTVTMDKDMRLTGVFAGDWERILEAAVARIRDYVSVPVAEPYDIVLTHGGYVGRDHYQTAKAAVGALPAVREGGTIIIAADNRDREPIGSPEYRILCGLLKLQGPDGYVDILRSPSWIFTRDQWEPEVWGKVLRRVGERGLVYCSPDIPEEAFGFLPGRSGFEFLLPSSRRKGRAGMAEDMLRGAVLSIWTSMKAAGRAPRAAFIREGPTTVPYRTGA